MTAVLWYQAEKLNAYSFQSDKLWPCCVLNEYCTASFVAFVFEKFQIKTIGLQSKPGQTQKGDYVLGEITQPLNFLINFFYILIKIGDN